MLRFKKADSYSMPIFAAASCWWDIIDTSTGDTSFCQVMFSQANPRHPDYEQYMKAVEFRVNKVIDILNKAT